jgi:hypothetical protein
MPLARSSFSSNVQQQQPSCTQPWALQKAKALPAASAATPSTALHTATSACRNQRKKKALAETKDAYNQLLSDNQALLQQLEDTNREAYHAAEHFRQEVLGKSQKIAEQQTQLEQVGCQVQRKPDYIVNPARRRQQAGSTKTSAAL